MGVMHVLPLSVTELHDTALWPCMPWLGLVKSKKIGQGLSRSSLVK